MVGFEPPRHRFLLKNSGPAELLHTIRVIAAAGEALLAPLVARRLIAEFAAVRATRDAGEHGLAVLAQREREVLALIAHRLTNDEIATRLTLSPATARTHLSRAMAKLGARNRAQLVVIAHHTRLASPRHTDRQA